MLGDPSSVFAIGSWAFSAAHGEPVRILDAESIWNHTVYEVWIPRLAKVEKVRAETLAPTESPKTPSLHRITYAVSAARIADALTQDVLLAPLEAGVIPLPHQLYALTRAMEEDDSRLAHIGRRIQQLTRLEHFALPLIDALGSLPSAEKWGVWLEQLMGLAQMALRHPESVLSVLSELEPMREVGPASLDEVYDVLLERLGSLRTDPPKRRYGRVFIGSIEEARGRSFDVVFLPGLAEGLFPRRALEDPLLLDEHRLKLSAGLDTQDQRVARERMLLRSAAAA